MSVHLPLGISDFRVLREKKLTYVDKSNFLIEVLDRPGASVLLLPRPRRFGKTLNLSLARYFFEKGTEDLSHLFHGLAIWEAGEKYRAHFQRYPVIFISFRDVKGTTYEETSADIELKIKVLFREHHWLLASGTLLESEVLDFQSILNATASPALYRSALGNLSLYLHRATGERVVILIDEYDEPIHAGHVNGYGKEILAFFRHFMTAGLKDNPHLERGVVTGILRIAKESIFSGLNNLSVCGLLETSFSTCFGFTEPEVISLLAQTGQAGSLSEVRTWYNGYMFGDTVIYNPWSVLNFLAWGSGPKPYWINTSSNDLIKSLLTTHATRAEETFEHLLEGGGFETTLDENISLERLETNEDALWSLLVFSGYLRAERVPVRDTNFPPQHRLTIPNREVRLLYTGTFQEWLSNQLGGHGTHLKSLLRGLLGGDAYIFEKQLSAFVKNILSFHDIDPDEPERVYQAFLLGLCAAVEPAHRVRSNRESGKGRPDVMILPALPGKAGVVLELKVAREKTLEEALAEGERQVVGKEYEAELVAAGARPVILFVVAFDGKMVKVRKVGG